MGLFDRFKRDTGQKSSEQSTDILPGKDSGLIAAADNIDALTEQIIMEVDTDRRRLDTVITLPIDKLGILGSAAASLHPAFRSITQTTTTVNTEGLFRLANASAGDTIKLAKDGNFWGAFKRADGSSKFAKLTQVGPISSTTTTVMPIDPATVMIAAALYTVEKKLDSIEKTQKQIVSFLETEKESQIEADVRILTGTLREFKYNWDKEVFINGHYKQALDVKRTAEKNLQSYQRELQDIKVKAPVVANANVNATVKSLLKKFRYYRMSLYLFSLSSFIEVMLLGDFREEHIMKIKGDIEDRSMRYRQIYGACSAYVERIAENAIEANILKGIGNAGKAIGGVIGSIPLVKEGPVDAWLLDGGDTLKKNAKSMKADAIKALAVVGNPDTGVFMEKLNELNQITNHTSEIYFDRENIYLVAA